MDEKTAILSGKSLTTQPQRCQVPQPQTQWTQASSGIANSLIGVPSWECILIESILAILIVIPVGLISLGLVIWGIYSTPKNDDLLRVAHYLSIGAIGFSCIGYCLIFIIFLIPLLTVGRYVSFSEFMKNFIL